MAFTKSHRSESVPDVVHLADTAGVKARLGEHRIESLTGIAGFGIVVGVAGAVDVLPRKERKSRGHANGRGRDGAVKYRGTLCDLVDSGRLRVCVAVSTERIRAALVGHYDKYMLGFNSSTSVKISFVSLY